MAAFYIILIDIDRNTHGIPCKYMRCHVWFSVRRSEGDGQLGLEAVDVERGGVK